MTKDAKHFCECGKHYFHYALQKYVAVLPSGLVLLRKENWPLCVVEHDVERLASAAAK